MTRLLLLIDLQRDYFPGGRHPLVGADAAAARQQILLPDLGNEPSDPGEEPAR